MRAQLGEKLSPGTLTVPAAVAVSDQPLKNDTSTADRDSAVQSTSNGPTNTHVSRTHRRVRTTATKGKGRAGASDSGMPKITNRPRFGFADATSQVLQQPSTMVNNHEPMLLRTAAAARQPMAQQFLQHTADGGRRAQALNRHLLTVARGDSHRDAPPRPTSGAEGRAIGRAAPQQHPLQAKQLQQRADAAVDASQASGRRQIATLSKVKGACGRP